MTTTEWTPEEIEWHRGQASIAAMVDVKTFVSALDALETARARIAELEQAQTWIPVGDRLPPNGTDQIILTYWRERFIGHHIDGQWNYQGVTHWMPLPQPPK